MKHDDLIEQLEIIEDAASRLCSDYTTPAEKNCLAENVTLEKLQGMANYLEDAVGAFDEMELDP